MFEKLATAERVQVAKQKTERVVDTMLDLLALHESNAIVFYSDTLALQIPRSYAAHAFHLFQECMFRSEIVRLCALWDRPYPDLSREGIPTIIALIDNAEIIEALVDETHAIWTGVSPVDPSEVVETDVRVADSGRSAQGRRRDRESDGARCHFRRLILVAQRHERDRIV